MLFEDGAAQSDPTGPAPQAVLDGAAGPSGPAASLASSRVRPLDAVARALVRDLLVCMDSKDPDVEKLIDKFNY